MVRVDTPGYVRYLEDHCEHRPSLQERVEDELKSILVLLSKHLADYTSHSKRIQSKSDSYKKDEGDWSSTGDSVDAICACMWT